MLTRQQVPGSSRLSALVLILAGFVLLPALAPSAGAGGGYFMGVEVAPAAAAGPQPVVSGESAIPNQISALIGGYVNPAGAETTYRFEWGESASYGNVLPSGPEPSVGSGTEPVPVEARVEGLEVGRTYHFRLIASSSGGTAVGPDQTFTTYRSLGLPDNRRYEQVSPPYKAESNVEAFGTMAAVDGDRLLFVSRGSFAGQPVSLTFGTPYLATRTAGGWTTQGIGLPSGGLAYGSDGYMGFNPDMSKGVIGWLEEGRFGAYDPSAKAGYNLYLRDSETGSFQLLNGQLSRIVNDYGFVWGTPDFGKMAIESPYQLTSTPCLGEVKGSSACAYEWDHGTLRAASVLPDGEAVTAVVGASNTFQCNFEHSLSEDGRRLFFTPTVGATAGNIYAREDGLTTSVITESEQGGGGLLDTETKASFQDAEAAHGNKVLFTTTKSLVEEDTDSTRDLYMYDFTRPAGERLTLISRDENPALPVGAEVNPSRNTRACGGLVAASEDLSRVYFVAENQIVAGAPEAPGPKLYLWQEGASPRVTYIATLKSSETGGNGINAAPAVAVRAAGFPRTSRWSADGRFLAFMAGARLTPFDNHGEAEIYRYDAVTDSLVCITCSSDAFPSTGKLNFKARGGINTVNHRPQNVSDTGAVFFDTARGLVPADSNGVSDVYEYADGQLHLISRGNGPGNSRFMDASPSGDDVFFTTQDKLVGWDKDSYVDAYDARVGGGFPEPPVPAKACEGEACLPAPSLPNDPTPGSAGFSGGGNVAPPSRRPCRKAKSKRHRPRCGKHHSAKPSHRRGADR